jgi:hypothetical protein
MMGSNEVLLRRTHGRAHGERTRDVGDRGRDVGDAGEVVVSGLWRLLLERVEVLVLALEIVLIEAAQRLAVLAGLVSAAMSAGSSLAMYY